MVDTRADTYDLVSGMGRTTLLAVLGAVVVGSTGGGLAALHFTSPRARRAQVATTGSASVGTAPADAAVALAVAPGDTIVAAPAPVPAPSPGPAPAPTASLSPQLTAVLTRFATWSHDHAGAPCPDLATLGLAAHDPWGHDLALTCTDQPADQIVGVVSPGPDGVIGTDDDVASWTFGASITSLVRGPRWKSAPASLATSRRRPVAPPAGGRSPAPPDRVPITAPDRTPTPASADHPMPPAPPKPGPPAPDPSGDDIPARRSSR